MSVVVPPVRTPGEIIERRIWTPSGSSIDFTDGLYIQEIVPSITLNSADEQVHIHGMLHIVKLNINGQRFIQAELRRRTNGGPSVQITGPIGNVIPTPNSYVSNVFDFYDNPGPGVHVYTIDMDIVSGPIRLLGGGEGSQITFDKVYVPSRVIVSSSTAVFTAGPDPS